IMGLSAIATSSAREGLSGLLKSVKDPVTLTEVMGGVTVLRMRSEAPALRKLLNHESSYVRGHAVLFLGTLGDPSDFEQMLATTRALPRDQINEAVRGLELIGHPGTVDALVELKTIFAEPSTFRRRYNGRSTGSRVGNG